MGEIRGAGDVRIRREKRCGSTLHRNNAYHKKLIRDRTSLRRVGPCLGSGFRSSRASTESTVEVAGMPGAIANRPQGVVTCRSSHRCSRLRPRTRHRSPRHSNPLRRSHPRHSTHAGHRSNRSPWPPASRRHRWCSSHRCSRLRPRTRHRSHRHSNPPRRSHPKCSTHAGHRSNRRTWPPASRHPVSSTRGLARHSSRQPSSSFPRPTQQSGRQDQTSGPGGW